MAAPPNAALRSILIASSLKSITLPRTAWRVCAPPPTASSTAIRAAQDPQRGLARLQYRNAFTPGRPREPSCPAEPFQHGFRNRRLHRLARGLRSSGSDAGRAAARAAEEPDLDGPALAARPLRLVSLVAAQEVEV